MGIVVLELPHQPSQGFLRAALQCKALPTQFFFLPALPLRMSDLHHGLRPSPQPPASSPFSPSQVLSSNKHLASLIPSWYLLPGGPNVEGAEHFFLYSISNCSSSHCLGLPTNSAFPS